MITSFSERFLKDIAKLPSASVKSTVADVIEAVEAADNVGVLVGLKKLKGFKNAYRFRVGDYRIGVFITGNQVAFARLIHRRDIYCLFP